MPAGRTIGTVVGGVGGFLVGGPAGGMIGAGLGGAVGGEFDSQQAAYDGGRGVSRNAVHYRGLGAVGEADRASQMGAEGAARSRELGRQLGADAYFGAGTANNMARTAADRSSSLYGAADRSMAGAAGADAMQQGARGDSMAALGRLRSFYERGPGPSAAEAQLRAGQDANARNAMSIARTGGGSPSAARAAIRAAAAGGAQTNQAAATLRAQEDANWRQTQLSAMGAEQSGLQNVRAGDMGAMGTHIGAAGQAYGAAGNAANNALGYSGLGAQYMGMNAQTRMGAEGMANAQQQFGESSRQSILGTQLAADANRYGADKGVQVGMAGIQQRQDAANMAMAGSLIGTGVNYLGQQQASDLRAKENIQPTSAADIINRLDASYARESADVGPRTDLRPAGSYSYEYRDPARHGAGSYVGPMAQELEQSAAAGAVGMAPDGTKTVDPGRLTMVNTSAISEQQKRIDRLEQMLDQSRASEERDTGPRFGPTSATNFVPGRRIRGERA